MANRIDDALRFHEAALSIRGQRQQLLASNIANADTPNFKARDIDFSAAMSQAINRTENQVAGALTKTSGAHLDSLGNTNEASLMYRTTIQGNVDGNTVDMDVERNQFTDNALRYEASLTILGMQIKNLLSAIQG